MRPIKKVFLLALISAAFGTAGWAYYRGQVRQQATVQQFTQLEPRLAANNRLAKQQDWTTIRGIKRALVRNRQQARDMAILHEAEQIGFRTQTIIDTLQTLRRQLSISKNNSGDSNALVTVAPTTITVLAAHLDSYAAFIRQFVPNAAPLTQVFATYPKSSEFGAFYFKERPLAAVLSTYTQLETQVRRYSAEALNYSAQKAAPGCSAFDIVVLQAVAESNTVAPGATYRSQLFLAQSISDVYFSEVSANGNPVQLLYPGHAKLEFRLPSAGPAQPDTLRVQWQGVIRADGYPSDTAWQVTMPYFIVKPTAQ
ncbi:hypothetical protein FY528_13295 [Hymenobacter lutimineralis]|uniref:Uncharacterized protein n=1 Tax=Hymenobacter lutimineralis TaxID=2606448 RepID=A0A5D6V019_9BACT|nr:hypothetical protein [Hymenobacter lutimineralis]TYZ08418.1 hypothetical protein FY528_13295 [Hymenobacter lutimineralis]